MGRDGTDLPSLELKLDRGRGPPAKGFRLDEPPLAKAPSCPPTPPAPPPGPPQAPGEPEVCWSKWPEVEGSFGPALRRACDCGSGATSAWYSDEVWSYDDEADGLESSYSIVVLCGEGEAGST